MPSVMQRWMSYPQHSSPLPLEEQHCWKQCDTSITVSIRLALGNVNSMCIVKLTFMPLKQLLKGGELRFEIAPSAALSQPRSCRNHQIQPGGMTFRGKHSPAQLWRLQRHVTATFSPNWEYACPTGLRQRGGEAESPQPTHHIHS